MGRFISEVIIPLAVLIALAYYGIRYHQLKLKVASLDNPVLALPRRERRDRARELLKRDDTEHMQRVIEETTRYIKEGNTNT